MLSIVGRGRLLSTAETIWGGIPPSASEHVGWGVARGPGHRPDPTKRITRSAIVTCAGMDYDRSPQRWYLPGRRCSAEHVKRPGATAAVVKRSSAPPQPDPLWRHHTLADTPSRDDRLAGFAARNGPQRTLTGPTARFWLCLAGGAAAVAALRTRQRTQHGRELRRRDGKPRWGAVHGRGAGEMDGAATAAVSRPDPGIVPIARPLRRRGQSLAKCRHGDRGSLGGAEGQTSPHVLGPGLGDQGVGPMQPRHWDQSVKAVAARAGVSSRPACGRRPAGRRVDG